MYRDPVCGMEIDADDVEYSCEYRGDTYVFCSENCLRRFERNPQQFAGAKSVGSPAGWRH